MTEGGGGGGHPSTRTTGRRGTAPRSQDGAMEETKEKSLDLGKDKAYLRMGSSEGSFAGWAQDHRGVSTPVCICACMTLCVCVCT